MSSPSYLQEPQLITLQALFNDLKNVTLYAGVYRDSFYKPSALFTHEYATNALALATNRFELFAAVEAHTRRQIASLANSSAYMKILRTLNASDDGQIEP